MLEIWLKVFSPDNLRFIWSGMWLTLCLSVGVVLLSIPLGAILGLLRNYEKFVLGRIAAVYIEVFRNTPLLLWMFAFGFLVPGGGSSLPVRGGIALMLYTASVVAEIFRGGLNSVAKGQFEAAQSQGFTFFQTLWYIVLPQAFRRIVPSLLSQVITTVKDTSFLAGFGVLEFFRSVQVVLSQSGGNKIAIFSLYVFAALGYFAVCFALSCVVRATQRGRNLPAAHAH